MSMEHAALDTIIAAMEHAMKTGVITAKQNQQAWDEIDRLSKQNDLMRSGLREIASKPMPRYYDAVTTLPVFVMFEPLPQDMAKKVLAEVSE